MNVFSKVLFLAGSAHGVAVKATTEDMLMLGTSTVSRMDAQLAKFDAALSLSSKTVEKLGYNLDALSQQARDMESVSFSHDLPKGQLPGYGLLAKQQTTLADRLRDLSDGEKALVTPALDQAQKMVVSSRDKVGEGKVLLQAARRNLQEAVETCQQSRKDDHCHSHLHSAMEAADEAEEEAADSAHQLMLGQKAAKDALKNAEAMSTDEHMIAEDQGKMEERFRKENPHMPLYASEFDENNKDMMRAIRRSYEAHEAMDISEMV